jgi:hypothetical protein
MSQNFNTLTHLAGNAPNQRRGPKGYFQGSRKEFLESYIPRYLASKKGNRQKLWHELYSAWWLRYPWRLEDHKEPPADDPEKMARLAAVAPGDEPRKTIVERTLTEARLIFYLLVVEADRVSFQRVTTWFINRASAATNGSRRDTLSWFPLLRRLHKIRNPRPRRRTAAQQFMHDSPSQVNAGFISQHGDGKNMNSIQRLNLRCEVARSMLSNAHSNLVNDLESRAKAHHDAEMNEWSMTLDDVLSAEDVGQYVLMPQTSGIANLSFITRARDSLFDAVFPLLEAIGTYAGCYITLLAGNPGKDESDEGFFTA